MPPRHALPKVRTLVGLTLAGGLAAVAFAISGPDAGAPNASAPALVLEPAYNPDSPLMGRVRQLDEAGRVVCDHLGRAPDDLFGAAGLIVPDLDGDGEADLAIAAPNAMDELGDQRQSRVHLISGADGRELDQLLGLPDEVFGLGLALEGGGALRVLFQRLDPRTGLTTRLPGFGERVFSLPSLELVEERFGVRDTWAFAASRAEWVRVVGAADLNADGVVDGRDVLAVAGALAEGGSEAIGAAPALGDMDGSGSVDALDVALVAEAASRDGGGADAAGGALPSSPFPPPPGGDDPPDEPGFPGLGDMPGLEVIGCLDPVQEVRFEEPLEAAPEGQPVFGTPASPSGCDGDGGGGGGSGGPDDDGDGIPNSMDCDHPSYQGDPGSAACADDDGDGIPNQDDCDSPHYTGSAGACRCGDSDGDGIRNQNECEHACSNLDDRSCCRCGDPQPIITPIPPLPDEVIS